MRRHWLWMSTVARSGARKVGLTRLARFARVSGPNSYEAAFRNALLAEIRKGDVVWDIGANVGFYTLQFSEAAGQGGLVVAFEPVKAVVEQLLRTVNGSKNVRAYNVALGETEALAEICLGKGELPADSSLAITAGAPCLETVQVISGDELRNREGLPVPNVMKIDVEGFEFDVLRGLSQTLRQPAVRSIFCEVHFSVLEKRLQRFAPMRIVSFLEERGFAVKWVDRSHLRADRF